MVKLYEISKEYSQALTTMTEDGIDSDVIADSLAAIAGEFDDKAIACIKYEKGIEGDITALDNEIKRLSAMKKTMVNKKEAFREYIRSNMEACGIDKIEHPLFKITLKKATEIVVVEDEDKLPRNYIKTTTAPDKSKIKKDLQTGVEVEGAKIASGKRGLLVK